MRGAGLRRWAAGLVCVAVLGAAASEASAGTYHAFLCRVPYGPSAGKPAPTDNTTYTTVGPNSNSAQACASGLTMTAAMDGAVAHAYNDGAAVSYDTPAGLTIAGFRLWRHTSVGTSQPNGAPTTDIRYSGGGRIDVCTSGDGSCIGRGILTTPLAPENIVDAPGLAGVTFVRWTANCGGTPGGTCPAIGQGRLSAVFNVLAADMLLNDPTPPAVSGLGGPLLAAGTLTGAQSVTFTASDAGSGVHKGSLVVDGTAVSERVLDANGGACADLGVAPDARPSFVNTQPCPSTLSGLLTLDTDALAPGAHSLTILVADASGNQTVAHTGSITVVGSVPIGAPNGAGASRAAKLTARHSSTRKRTRRLTFKTRPTITGKLVDEAGKPITAAGVDILVRQRRTGAPNERIATATTGADGSFKAPLPSGPSRTISVQYTAFKGDPKPAGTVRLIALVRAQVSASVSPRSPRARQRLRISGRLKLLPRRGVIVSIQARDGRKWRTVDTVETRKDGRYSWPYRFSARSAGRTFAFRARVKSPNYPFDAGNSKAVRVRVR